MSTTQETPFDNPYAAPLTGPEERGTFQSDDARIRAEFIDCEANIRSIAGLMMVGGFVLAVVLFFMFVLALGGAEPERLLVVLFLLDAAAVGQLAVGAGLRQFRGWARGWAIFICILWLVVIPVGTFFGGISLWYLLRPAAKVVFDPKYKTVMANTPEVRVRTSALSWIVLLLLMFVVGLVVLYAVSVR